MKKALFTVVMCLLCAANLSGAEPGSERKRSFLHFSVYPPMSSNGSFADRYVNNISISLFQANSLAIEGFAVAGLANVVGEHIYGIAVSGIWTNSGGELYGAGISGFCNFSSGTRGMQVAGLSNISKSTTMGLQVGGLGNLTELMYGAQIGGLFNLAEYGFGFQVTGLGNVSRYFTGIQTAGLFSITRDFRGVQVSGLSNISRNARGVQIGGLANISRSFEGIQISGLANIGRYVNGVQFSGLGNYAERVTGLQFAGLYNRTEISVDGMQFSGISNSAYRLDGCQIAGVWNSARQVRGFQFAGIANVATGNEGFQFAGLFNVSRGGNGHSLAFVNILWLGEMSLGAEYNHSTGSYTALFRSGGRVLYGIAGLGYNRTKSKDDAVIELGYGAHINVNRWFRINNELRGAYIGRFNHSTYRYSYNLFPAFKPVRHLELYAGPTLGLLTSDSRKSDYLMLSGKSDLWSKVRTDKFSQLSLSFAAGVNVIF